MKTSPEVVVQGQLDAYDARDIDGFMLWWSNDCQCHLFPDTLIATARRAAGRTGRHCRRLTSGQPTRRTPGAFRGWYRF